MRLLLYSHFFAPSIGGVENIVLSLARGLADRHTPDGVPEFDVTLVTDTPASGFDDSALPFRVVRRPGAWRLVGLIRRADVVHLAGPVLLPMLLALLQGKPYVIEHHGYQAICPNGLLLHLPDRSVCEGYFQKRRYQECLRCNESDLGWWQSLRLLLLNFPRYWLAHRARANAAITNHVERRQGLPNSQVIYYGIPDLLSENQLPSGGPQSIEARSNLKFAYVGRLVQEKGLDVLLEALRLLQEEGRRLDLKFVGGGPELQRLEVMAARLPFAGDVHFEGFCTGSELDKAMADVDVVVMPSVWEETAGLAAMEQMMRGRLVIASAVGGLADVVGDAGLTVPPGDPTALAVCMRRVLDDSSLIVTIGTKARERALALFAHRRMIEEHASIYGRLYSRVRGDLAS